MIQRVIPSLSEIWNQLRNNRILQIMILIMGVGVVLRFWGIWNAENTDEYNEVFEALRVASGKFNLERWHKKGYQNILAIEYGFYFIVGYVLNVFQNPMDFAAKIVRNMEPLFLIGRYTTATLGALSIGLIYLVGRKLFNARVGLFAAATLAVCTVHVWTSHLVNTDIPLVFFFLVAMYFISRFYYSGKTIDYVLASFFGAAAINIKLIGVGIGIIFIMAHVIRSKNEGKKVIDYVYSKEILWATIAFAMGLIATNPPIIFGLKKLIAYHSAVYANVYDEVPYATGGNGYYTYLILLLKELGLPLFILTIVSMGFALYKREDWDYILLLFVGGMYVLLGGTAFLVQDRYLMIIMVALFVLNSRFLDVVVRKCFGENRKGSLVLVVVGLLILWVPLLKSVKYVRTLSEENTSVVSKRWIEENVPAGSKILMDAGRTIISFGPRLNESRENLEKKINVVKNLKQGETYDSPLVRIVDSYSSVYFELLLKNMPEITYDLTSTELGRKVETPDYYKKSGYDYFIHNKGFSDLAEAPLWRRKYPKSAEFYDSFKKEFKLIKTFSPSATRSGSTIEIYKIR